MNYVTLMEWTGKRLRIVPVEIERWHGTPFKVRYAGHTYRPTGEMGRDRSTGEAVLEWSTRDVPGTDRPIWTNDDISRLWED